jgi:hypothetical protein
MKLEKEKEKKNIVNILYLNPGKFLAMDGKSKSKYTNQYSIQNIQIYPLQ